MTQKVVKIILKELVLIFLFAVLSFALYPNPIEIIIFFIIYLVILMLLVLVDKNLDKLTLNFPIKLKSLIKGFFYTITSLYALYFSTAFVASWFEKEIILNLFKVKRGQAYLIILVSLVTVILIYCVIFYFKKKRLPSSDEINDALSLKRMKEVSLKITLKNIFLYIIVIVFVAIFWTLLFLTKG